MHLLWTVSNWKRTGPVEPSLGLARALVARGHRVDVAVGTRPPGAAADEPRNDTEDVVAAYGLARAQTPARLHKHSAPWRDLRDVGHLSRWLRQERPAAIVTTLRNDHGLATRAARAFGIPVVRLWFGDGSEDVKAREVRALRTADGIVAFGERPAQQLRALGCDAGQVHVCGAPLDIEQLRADLPPDRAGADAGAFRFGIVARMQTHRRFELLWEAVRRLKAAEGPPFELWALGRGTNQDVVARTPVRELDLEDVVTFPGYLRGAAYVEALASLHAQFLLVPGSDATCRALREGMALGVPSIATRRGLLPEIVEDGVTGLVVDETPEALVAAMETLRRAPERAQAFGAAARERAERAFDVRVVAGVLDDLLTSVCGLRRTR